MQPETGTSSDNADAEDSPLAALRQRIDEFDERLVKLLGDRAAVVVEIGEAKQRHGTPTYAPHRETAVLARAIANNRGPLSDRTIEAIFRELMSGSFTLELPMRVGFLGPPGSYSHIAAVRHFGSSVDCGGLGSIDGVFEEVAARRCDYGLVPYENSIGGGITDTLDALVAHDVTICAEALIEVTHSFLANCPPAEIERIYSRREVFGQCRRWLNQRYPNTPLESMESSAAAVQRAAAEPGAAAVGSSLAGELYGVNMLFERIEDTPNNITRFLIIGRQAGQPSGDDKTTIMFVTADKPGALVDVLAVFRDAEINLSHIDKRPSGRTNWEYTFFVDAEGHHSESKVTAALSDARRHCVSIKVLGSYPRATRIL